MVFAILNHRLNTAGASNYYFVRTDGRMFCRYAMLKGSVPLAPLGSPQMASGGEPPSSEGYFHNVFLSIALWIGLDDARVRENVSGGLRWARQIGCFRFPVAPYKSSESPQFITPSLSSGRAGIARKSMAHREPLRDLARNAHS